MDGFTAQEIQKRYSNCHGFVSYNGKNFPVRFANFHIDLNREQYTAIVESESGVLELDMNKLEIFPIQHSKLFQVGPTFCLFSRTPKRQYRKGYNGDNTIVFDVVIQNLSANGVQLCSDKFSKISLETVKGFHETKYTNSLEEAISKLGKDCIGVAITSTFGLALSYVEGADYILFYLHKPIALISGKDIKVLNLKQEVVDFVKYFSKGGYNVVE